MKIYAIILLFLLPTGKSDWELKKEKSDILVYTRKVIDSDFDEFKGVTTLFNTDINTVLNVILDVKNYDKLIPDCFDAKPLKTDGPYYDIHYFAIKGPPMVQDRDAVYEQKTNFSKDGKTIKITLVPLPDYIPDHPDRIRMHNGTGGWTIVENKDASITVTYQFHGDPEGDIPAWLANSSVVSHPFKALTNLKSRALNPTKK